MIEWEDKFSVGISVIDEDHKDFIGILNKASFANENHSNIEGTKEVIGEMLEFSCTHFKAEEEYMRNFKFPEPKYEFHRNEHLDFIDKAINNYNKLIRGEYHIAKEILEYLKQWLVNHIQGTDTKYIKCFKKNGLN